MAFFEGGRVPTVAVPQQSIGNTSVGLALRSGLQQAASLGVNTLFQGSGQSFLAGAGQAVASVAADNLISIGLNSILGQDIASSSGIDLTSGQNFLSTVLTQGLTPILASSVNSTIQDSLATAGPFGSVFANPGSGLAGSLLGGGGGQLTPDNSPSLRFPGASEEPPAYYGGGGSYALGDGGADVVFSLQPANQGPQLFGQQFLYDSKIDTKLNLGEFEVPPNYSASEYTKNQDFKLTEMFGEAASISNYDFAKDFDPTFENPTFGFDESLNAFQPQEGGWTFIVAPEDISWDLANAANRVDMFGTNNPPVVAGSKGMRDLSIGNALVEGFTRRVTVEYKIRALEKLMNYSLNGTDGFVSVPVYQFWADNKAYGSTDTETGYFIIRDVKINEKMRDLAGQATRAMVDISLMQVPKYQVNTGRDQASEATTGARSGLIDRKTVQQQAKQQGATSGPGAGNGRKSSATATGSSAPANTKPSSSAQTTGGRTTFDLSTDT